MRINTRRTPRPMVRSCAAQAPAPTRLREGLRNLARGSAPLARRRHPWSAHGRVDVARSQRCWAHTLRQLLFRPPIVLLQRELFVWEITMAFFGEAQGGDVEARGGLRVVNGHVGCRRGSLGSAAGGREGAGSSPAPRARSVSRGTMEAPRAEVCR